MGIPDHLTCLLGNLYAGQEAIVRTGHGNRLVPNWERSPSRLCLSSCLFNSYCRGHHAERWAGWITSWNQDCRKNINNLIYADDTTIMAKSKEELRNLLMKVKEESVKAGLKLNIQKLRPWHLVLSVSSVYSLNHVQVFATPCTAERQPSMPITNSLSLLRLMSIELVMPSNHLILCHALLLLPSIFQASGSFQKSQFFASRGQSTGVSASTSVLPINIQDWSPLGLTGWISLQSKGLSWVFSNTTV